MPPRLSIPAWLTRLLIALRLQRRPLGPHGEYLAAAFLRRHRYRILERNTRTPIGEADLVCEAPDGRTLVIVEVKTRFVARAADGTPHQPPPEASITARKQDKLARVAIDLARRRGWERRPMRIDVIAIEVGESGKPTIRHHIGAVRMSV